MARIQKTSLLFVLGMGIISVPVSAQDFGQIGTVYSIQEENLLHVIYARLEKLDMNFLQNDIIKKIKQQIARPKPVEGITTATHLREWDVDPTQTILGDIVDDKGHLVVKAGTQINPLKKVPLHSILLFLNADDPNQVTWAQTHLEHNKKNKKLTKLILVKGDILLAQSTFNQAIYFDQGGRLTTRFHISQVPAEVAQQGDHLHVMEGGL